MKKIILLLTVLTLGVVACDKNELGMDMDGSSINAIEATVEKSAMDHDFDSSVTRLLGKLGKSNQPNTSKTVAAGSTIKFYIYSDAATNAEYEIFIGDDIDSCAPSDDFLLIELVFVSTSLTEVYFDGTKISDLAKDLTNAFAFDELFVGDKIDFANGTISPASGSGTSITF